MSREVMAAAIRGAGAFVDEAEAKFAEAVDKYGRNSDAELIRKYYLRTNPFKIFGQMKLATKLYFKGRLTFFPHKVKGLDGLRKMMAAVEETGAE